MKAKAAMDPAAAFPDQAQPPCDKDLPPVLGRAASSLDEVLANLRSTQPAVVAAWQFSERSGWYMLLLLKKRRLIYLVPKRGDVRVMMILGRKAVAQLQEGPFARQTDRLLKTAKHYPEGIAFTFDGKSLDPDLLGAFLAAKIAH